MAKLRNPCGSAARVVSAGVASVAHWRPSPEVGKPSNYTGPCKSATIGGKRRYCPYIYRVGGTEYGLAVAKRCGGVREVRMASLVVCLTHHLRAGADFSVAFDGQATLWFIWHRLLRKLPGKYNQCQTDY